MGERNQEPASQDSLEELFEPLYGDLSEEMFQEMEPVSTEKQKLVAKRRLAEKRLEEKRLRDELGDYDLEFDDG
ncbi:MAG: PA3496 family putative envelope integrity protein [Halioglobus sp.]